MGHTRARWWSRRASRGPPSASPTTAIPSRSRTCTRTPSVRLLGVVVTWAGSVKSQVRPGRSSRTHFGSRPSAPYTPWARWRWATAGAITGWVAHRWANPIYYSYGSGGTVYYENNVVYVDGQQYGSAQQYYEDTSQLAESVPEMTDEQAEQTEWLPLGVFALTAEGVNATSM